MTMRRFYVVVLVLAPFVRSSAQYYEPREYAPPEARYLTIGFAGRDFRPLSTNPQPDSLAIRYNRVMPMISFKQGTAEFYLGYTTFTLSGGSKSTVLFGGRFGVEVPIAGRKSNTLLFPLELGADFTRVSSVSA